MLEQIKKKASGLLEQRLLKTGRVLEVRHWTNSVLVEVDLHLPATEMDNWNEVNYIKCKVNDFTYRDYTPSGWDAETRTCTLYIDTSHPGAGSSWALNLKQGDEIGYIGLRSTRQSPVNTSAIVCLGDESSLGHLLAMQQLSLPVSRFSGAVTMKDENNCSQFKEFFKSPLEPLKKTDTNGQHTLADWLLQQSYSLENTIFYLVGNNTMVSGLRKLLKNQGYRTEQIKAQGFWG